MKKFRFIFLVLALILVVGMTTGVIVRKQTGSQTVLQHSGGGSAASTTPATTGDDEPAAPEPEVFKIPILIDVNALEYFSITENGVVLDPIDTFVYGSTESKGGDAKPADSNPDTYSYTFARFLVDPENAVFAYDFTGRRGGATPYAAIYYLAEDQYESCQFDFDDDGISSNDSITGRISLVDRLCFIVRAE